MGYKFGYNNFMLCQSVGAALGMWLYASGTSVVLSLIVAVFLLVSMMAGHSKLGVNRPDKDRPTLLLDGMVVVLSWASFFFIADEGLWMDILLAVAFVFCLSDMVLWTKTKQQLRQITSAEAVLCVVESLAIVALTGYCIVDVASTAIDMAVAVLILLCLAAIALAGYVALKALKRKSFCYDEMRFGIGIDVVFAVFMIYDFMKDETNIGLPYSIMFMLLLAIDFARSLVIRK